MCIIIFCQLHTYHASCCGVCFHCHDVKCIDASAFVMWNFIVILNGDFPPSLDSAVTSIQVYLHWLRGLQLKCLFKKNPLEEILVHIWTCPSKKSLCKYLVRSNLLMQVPVDTSDLVQTTLTDHRDKDQEDRPCEDPDWGMDRTLPRPSIVGQKHLTGCKRGDECEWRCTQTWFLKTPGEQNEPKRPKPTSSTTTPVDTVHIAALVVLPLSH